MTNESNNTTDNIITIAKCGICGKMFTVPLSPDMARAFENSKELRLVCPDCVKKEIYRGRIFKPIT